MGKSFLWISYIHIRLSSLLMHYTILILYNIQSAVGGYMCAIEAPRFVGGGGGGVAGCSLIGGSGWAVV